MDATKEINISIEQLPYQTIQCWKITIKGYLDAYTGCQLIYSALSFARQASVRIIVDLKGISFIDGAGWDVLVHIGKEVSGNGGRIALINMAHNVERVYQLLSLETTLPSFTSEIGALHYLL